MTLATHKQWLRQLALPSLLLTVLVLLWGATLGVLIQRMLGVTISAVNGRPATFADELLINGLEPAVVITFLHCLLLLFLFIGRVAFRWWLVAGLLAVVGTPLAFLSGSRIADYLWTLNQGGTPWEDFAPQILGLVSAWVLSVPLALCLSRYRIVIVRRDDQRRSPCPRCGYDLFGSSKQCPECGWVLPIGVSTEERSRN